jgi:hypothetical protein
LQLRVLRFGFLQDGDAGFLTFHAVNYSHTDISTIHSGMQYSQAKGLEKFSMNANEGNSSAKREAILNVLPESTVG